MRSAMKILRAALTAAALGTCAAAAAVPAQAAGFSFGFGFGYGDHDRDLAPFCVEMTDHQLRQAIARKGFTNIYLNVRDHHRIQIKASQGGWVYLLRVSTCTATILDSQRLRRS